MLSRGSDIMLLSLVQTFLFVKIVFALSLHSIPDRFSQLFQAFSLLETAYAEQTSADRMCSIRQLPEGTLVTLFVAQIGQATRFYDETDLHFELAPFFRVFLAWFTSQIIPMYNSGLKYLVGF